MNPPDYFNRVAAITGGLWEKLKDPVLAGPWRQLFAQVQSPRHVLSELLQNADDAGAKSASVRVVNNEFVFEHDGEDFIEEQFQSLCRFGYSNKRNLHTIGFRGVGFKSTFSLGDRVRIQTPTLDVYYDRERFTLPVWSANATGTARTRITVRFADKLRERQLRMNFEEWITSPVSLLFFRNLQELTIESHTVRKEILARGPIAGSQRIRLTGASTEELLLIRSEEEAFPEDVMDEIKQERNADDLHLPPCSVELVLGLDGDQRLFVVLPAGTDVDLPYSINAPFLQDPARQKIKEPEVSPCNRWLLERAGRLAGEAMTAWLGKDHLTTANRANAYDLLRGPVTDAADLKTAATKEVLDAMLAAVEDEPVLLTTEDRLAPIGECTALPSELHEVWDVKELKTVFAKTAKHLLSAAVKPRACRALEAHGWIETISAEAALQTLAAQPVVPKPTTAVRLQLLWNWVEQNIVYDWNGERRRTLRIVPVEGQPLLQPGNEVIRVSARGQQLSEADWNFISNFALAIDQEWITHLNKLKSKDKEADAPPALELLQVLGLHEPSQVDRIAAQASRRLLARGKMPMEDCVRIAHIFAALDATVPEDFRYVSENLHLRQPKDHPIVFDADGEVEAIVPKAWAAQHLLHSHYVQEFKSCTEERWYEWAYSSKSKLHAFVPLTLQPKRVSWRSELEKFLADREGSNPKEYRYKNDRFTIDDYDFPPEVLQHWKVQAVANPKLWPAVVKGLLLDPLAEWEEALNVTVRQISAQSTTSALSCGTVLPAWLVHLRSVACLTDTHGNLRTPPELLLRTPNTESSLGIETFVDAELDDTVDKKKLLRLLGVRDNATDWKKVVDRLRGLTKIKDTMRVLADVLRLYEALDRIAIRCSAEDMNELRTVFAAEALILSNKLEWFSSGELSLHADPEDDSPVVHSAAHGLALWLRVGVSERPALEKSLEWLKTLAAGTRLEGLSYKRATVALTRGGRRVWDELGHWLSLDQTWEAVTTLKYRVSMRNLTRWEKLTAPTKRTAADLRMLHGEVAEEAPFTVTRALAEVIAMQVTNVQAISGRARRMEWLQPLADGLCRVKLRDEAVTAKVREVARRLLNTTWQTVGRLEVTPYIDGTPAGEPLMPKVLWSDTKLYLVDLATVRLMRELKEELTRPFGVAEVMEAVADCIDRDVEFVREYLAANFELEAQAELQPGEKKPDDKAEKPKGDKTESEGEADDDEGATEPEEVKGEAGEAEAGNEDDLSPEEVEGEDVPPKGDKSPKPKEPTFMDRYAKARGFRWHEGERCYTHANGAWIAKGETPFNWQEGVNGSDATKRLFVAEESLLRGVEIPYELWRLRDEAVKRIGHLYPKVKLPKENGGGEATVIAWLWTRTVASPNPAAKGKHVPLVRSFWLSTKADKKVWVEPIVDQDALSYRFEIRTGTGQPRSGTVGRNGGVCLLTGSPMPLEYVRSEGKAGRIGARLMVIVADGPGGRTYLQPNDDQERVAKSAEPSNVPDTDLPEQALGFRVQNYGMTKHRHLFTNRQLVALTTFSDLVGEARSQVLKDGGEQAYADAVATYLGLGVGRLSDICNALCSWETSKTQVRHLFTRQAISMLWDFGENNIFGEAAGDFGVSLGNLCRAVNNLPSQGNATVQQLNAEALAGQPLMVFSTDPPYYDNVPYADLSDFFYVWLRRSLQPIYPQLLGTLLVPKAEELIAEPFRHGGKEEARSFFEVGMGRVFKRMRDASDPRFPTTIYYAFKQAEGEEEDDEVSEDSNTSRASTGWETFLQGLVDAGWQIDGTWPMRTELSNRMRGQLSNALASSIVLVCRPRPKEAAVASRRDCLAALKRELPEALRNLQKGNIAPVDLAQAAIGPGMAVFSRYAQVLEANGSPMSVRTALALINQSLDEVLAEQEGEFDADTRWALAWFDQNGFNEGAYGVAETLCTAKNTSVSGMVEAGIVAAKGGKVRLLKKEELLADWNPAADDRLTVWEATHHLIRSLDSGEQVAAALLKKLGAMAEVARDLSYRLYTVCERRKWSQDAIGYNALVLSWPDLKRLADEQKDLGPAQRELI